MQSITKVIPPKLYLKDNGCAAKMLGWSFHYNSFVLVKLWPESKLTSVGQGRGIQIVRSDNEESGSSRIVASPHFLDKYMHTHYLLKTKLGVRQVPR